MKKIIALVLACILALSMTGCKSSDYEEAVSLYEAGKYDEADQLFAQLGGYRDSVQLRLACRHAQAMELYDAEAYEEAAKLFEKLGNYEDSATMLKACYYYQASQQQKAKEYETAMLLYQQAAGYKDSDTRALKCRQMYVTTLIDEGLYSKALPHLKALKKLGSLSDDSNAIGWCTLAAFLQENRGFSNVQTYAFSMRLTEDGAIEILAHLAEEDDSNIKNKEITTNVLDYSVKIGYNASEADTAYTYNTRTEKKVYNKTRNGWGKETANTTISISDFTPEAITWENLQYEGEDVNKKKPTEPYNAMSGLTLETIYREMNLALEETELGITLRDLGFVSLAV